MPRNPIEIHEETFPPRYTRISLNDGTSILCAWEVAEQIDAALTTYIESGRNRDQLVMVEHLSGMITRFLASDVKMIDQTTREANRRQLDMNAASTHFWEHDPSKPWQTEP